MLKLTPFICCFVCLLATTVLADRVENSGLSRGFGDDIDWFSFKDALELSAKHYKPILLIIHKSWCGACSNVKMVLQNSTGFKQMSSYFLMVNVEDDEEPIESEYAPDGNYVPRFLFLDPRNRKVRADLMNERGHPSYKYFYSREDEVLNSMKNAIERFRNEAQTHSAIDL